MVDRRRTPNMWEYFKHPERYLAMHQTYGTPLPRTRNGEQPGVAPYLDAGRGARPLPVITDTEDWLRQQPIGPGGVVADAPWALPRAPHMTVAQAAASPAPVMAQAPPTDPALAMGEAAPLPALPGPEPVPQHNDAPALMGAFGRLGPRIADARARARMTAANAQAAHRDAMASMGANANPLGALLRALSPRW